MTDRPLLSACLIAKNEKPNVRRCLDSLWPHVDEVCVADTGSTDGTIAEFKRYAEERGELGKLKTTRFTACNFDDGEIADFAAARQAADDLATGEWFTWADVDDSVEGLDRLRKLAEDASDDVQGFFVRYSYAQDPTGNTISELWRERIVRNDGTKWTGRLHEHKLFTKGTVVKVDPSIAEWVHHRDHTQRSGARNLRILEAWDKDEPNDPRIISSLALEYMGLDRYRDASETFARFLECEGEPPDRRAQATRHMCVMLMMQGRPHEARAAALASLGENWLWADTHLTLAEAEQTLGHPDVAIMHAREAQTIGKPDTLLIVNPLQYTAHPRAVQAVCLAQMGRFEEAVRMADECLEIAPTYQLAAQHVPLWRGQVKRQHALNTVLALADVLVEVGELIKARDLLDVAPYYVDHEPLLIRKRGEIVRQIKERMDEPEVAEDEAADAFIARHLKEAA
jgi:tetratricopeptide (TPR) repeat protein